VKSSRRRTEKNQVFSIMNDHSKAARIAKWRSLNVELPGTRRVRETAGFKVFNELDMEQVCWRCCGR